LVPDCETFSVGDVYAVDAATTTAGTAIAAAIAATAMLIRFLICSPSSGSWLREL
jgi:hypothetical protein